MFDESDSSLISKQDIDELNVIYKNKSLEDYFTSNAFKNLCAHSTESLINLANYYGNKNPERPCAIYMAFWYKDKIFEIPENHDLHMAKQYLRKFIKKAENSNIPKNIIDSICENTTNDTHYYLTDLVDRFAEIFATDNPTNPELTATEEEQNIIGIKAELNKKPIHLKISVDNFISGFSILNKSHPEHAKLFHNFLTDKHNIQNNLEKILGITWGDFLDMKRLEGELKEPKTLHPINNNVQITKTTDDASTFIALTAALLVSSLSSFLLTKKTQKTRIKKPSPDNNQNIAEETNHESKSHKRTI